MSHKKKKDMTPAQKAAARRNPAKDLDGETEALTEEEADFANGRKTPGLSPLASVVAGIALIALVAGLGYAFAA